MEPGCCCTKEHFKQICFNYSSATVHSRDHSLRDASCIFNERLYRTPGSPLKHAHSWSVKPHYFKSGRMRSDAGLLNKPMDFSVKHVDLNTTRINSNSIYLCINGIKYRDMHLCRSMATFQFFFSLIRFHIQCWFLWLSEVNQLFVQ